MTIYCQLCGRPADGRSQLFRHPRWPAEMAIRVCTTCQHEKPRCRECGLPIQDNMALCATCSRMLPVCRACGQPVQGAFYEFDGVGPYCTSCYQSRPRCDVCSAPLTDEHWQLSDGRRVCAHCHETAIYAPAEASVLYEEMKDVVASRLGLVLNIPTGLAVVDRNQIGGVIYMQSLPQSLSQNLSQNLPQNQAADTVSLQGQADLDPLRTLGLYARRGIRRGIYVQTGLPRLLFLQVAAHEYAHAWQGENCPVLKDSLIHEGFAEWVAYHVIGYYGYHRGQQRMLARDDLYGAGLRWALDVENHAGTAGVIDACRKVTG